MKAEDVDPCTWVLAGTAGGAVLVLLLTWAGVGGRVSLLPDAPGLRTELPSMPAATTGLGTVARYAEISARPLLSQDRTPKPFSLQENDDESEVEHAAFDYVLTSVLITPRLKLVVLQPESGGESVRVKLDQAPESHPAWRLVELMPRSAVFEGPEGKRTMELRVFDGEGGMRPTASVAERRSGPTRPDRPAGEASQVIKAPEAASSSTASQEETTAVPARRTSATARPATTSSRPAAEQRQMDAIRQRIQARREQLNQQRSRQSQAPAKRQ